MPGFNDLELQDLDLKPYMDPALLLDALSPDDMEMWECGYNFFSEENVNSSFKDSVKEENMETEYCLSSICPNDLLNNMDSQNYIYSNNNINFDQNNSFGHSIIGNNIITNNNFTMQDRYDSYSSSSYSSPSSSFSQNLEDNHQSFNLVPYILNSDQNGNKSDALNSENIQRDFKIEESSTSSNSDQKFFQLDSTAILSSSASQSPIPSAKQFSSIKEFNIFKQQADNSQMQDLNSLSNIVLITNSNGNKNKSKTVIRNNKKNSAAVLLSKPSKSKQTIKKLTALSEKSIVESNIDTIVTSNSNNPKQLKKATLLPPSPPSSFGSESDSDNSSSSEIKKMNVTNTKNSSSKQITNNINYTMKASKLNNSLRSCNTYKYQTRHQPYTIKSPVIFTNNKIIKVCPPLEESTTISVSSSNRSNIKEERDNSCDDDDCWPFLCSLSKLPSSGPLLLTEEEKRTLIQEGHQVPSQLPLSKGEEKILKKIRRKIKNKISAQESRRKKKEYVDSLEKRMDNYISENSELKKRLEELASNNKNLLTQLQTLTATLEHQSPASNNSIIGPSSNLSNGENFPTNSNQFGTLIMVLILFFAVVLGVWSPVFTKDQMTRHLSGASTMSNTATVAVAAANVVSSSITQRVQTNSLSSGAAAVTAVCAAASAIASSFNVKTESVTPSHSPSVSNSHQEDDSSSFISHQNQIDNKHVELLMGSIEADGSFIKFSPKTENDDISVIDTNSNATNGINIINHNNNLVRSKTGTAVEITKVRPFMGKTSTLSKTVPINGLKSTNLLSLPLTHNHHQAPLLPSNINKNQSEMTMNSGDENPILVLNMSNAGSNEIPNDLKSSSPNLSLGSIIGQKININSGDNKLGGNYRVINTNTYGGFSGSVSPCSSAKLTTRFRVINNSQNSGYSNSSIIKLNTPF